MDGDEVAIPQSPSGAQPGALHIPKAAVRAQRVGPLDRHMEILLTFVLRPRDRLGLEARALRGAALSLDEVDRRFGPSPSAARRLTHWLRSEGVSETVVSPGGSLLEVRVPVPLAERLLRTHLDVLRVGGVRGYAPRCDPVLPSDVASLVSAVLGLNGLAQPRRRKLSSRIEQGAQGPASGGGFMPAEIRTAYGLPDPPSLLDGRGECLCVLEFGSAFTRHDLETFWQRAGVRSPSVDLRWALPPGQEAPVAGSPATGADLEATSDLEWAGALAPGASLTVVNSVVGESSQSFAQALARSLETVVTLPERPSVVSISYGDGEIFFGPAELLALDQIVARLAACGITVLAASGDDGAYGVSVPVGPVQTVDVPASLPHVLAVGGTHLELQDGVVARELGWSDIANNGASGGGVSEVFVMPPWQGQSGVGTATGTPADVVGRGVPDVAANADPLTGYRIVVGGELGVVGGTSLSTPVWAAALTVVNQRRLMAGQGPLGLAAPKLYAVAGRSRLIRDILVGDNTYLSAPGYACCTGWDAVTGVGSPAGTDLWDALSGPSVPVRAASPAGSQARDRPKEPDPEGESLATPAAVEPAPDGGGGGTGGEEGAPWPPPDRTQPGTTPMGGVKGSAHAPPDGEDGPWVLEPDQVPTRRTRVSARQTNRGSEPGKDVLAALPVGGADKAPGKTKTARSPAVAGGVQRTRKTRANAAGGSKGPDRVSRPEGEEEGRSPTPDMPGDATPKVRRRPRSMARA